jgi:hypothetical protein
MLGLMLVLSFVALQVTVATTLAWKREKPASVREFLNLNRKEE